MLYSVLINPTAVIVLLILGLLCAILAPYLRSSAGTPEEIAARTATMRRAGLVLAATAAAILIVRRFGLFR
jgi:hypothetical protein